MSKIEEAKEILSALQVPAKQQNGMCCCVLLAMADLLIPHGRTLRMVGFVSMI